MRTNWSMSWRSGHGANQSGYHYTLGLSNGLSNLPNYFRSPEGATILPLLGVWGRRDRYEGDSKILFVQLQSDRTKYARPYYVMSWGLVNALIEQFGVDRMRAVVQSDQPAQTFKRMSGQALARYVTGWSAQF